MKSCCWLSRINKGFHFYCVEISMQVPRLWNQLGYVHVNFVAFL